MSHQTFEGTVIVFHLFGSLRLRRPTIRAADQVVFIDIPSIPLKCIATIPQHLRIDHTDPLCERTSKDIFLLVEHSMARP